MGPVAVVFHNHNYSLTLDEHDLHGTSPTRKLSEIVHQTCFAHCIWPNATQKNCLSDTDCCCEQMRWCVGTGVCAQLACTGTNNPAQREPGPRFRHTTYIKGRAVSVAGGIYHLLIFCMKCETGHPGQD